MRDKMRPKLSFDQKWFIFMYLVCTLFKIAAVYYPRNIIKTLRSFLILLLVMKQEMLK